MTIDSPRGERPTTDQPLLTRRAALAVFAGLGLSALAVPGMAVADTVEEAEAKVKRTEAELAEAQRKYDETQARLEELAKEFEELSRAHDGTLKKIEETNAKIAAKQAEIDAKQAEVDAKQAELDEKQDILSKRIASAYKTGNAGLVELLLSSSSFEELASNVYYLDKISDSDARMIDEVREVREQLDAQRLELEEQKAELEEVMAGLEELKAEQESQLEAMTAKQDEVAEMLANLDDDVKELMERRDAEMLAAAEERAKQERARRAAAAALIDVGGGQDYQASATAQRDVVNACYATSSPGYGLCAMWVSQVFDNAGFTYYGGNACDMYSRWCYSSSKDELQVGMIIAVASHPHTTLGRIYGHVGIYIGDGVVMDNIGRIRTIDCDEWINYYGGTVTPRWGWCGGVALA